MNEEIYVDRSVSADFHIQNHLDALNAAVARGDWTMREAALSLEAFKNSAVLQQLIDNDVAMVTAMMNGQIH